MEVEKRGDKYVLIFPDGEIELSEQEYLDRVQRHEIIQIYMEKGLERSKYKNWTADNAPKELDIITAIDTQAEVIKNLYQNGANAANLISAIDSAIQNVEFDLVCPLEKDSKEVNEYLRKTLIELKKELSENQTKKTKKKKTSYVWQGSQDELPLLHNLMVNEYKLIVPETTYEQSQAVFTGQPIESIHPIKWHQDNASELLYFIDRLKQSHQIEHNPKRADYQKLKACFVKPDGSQFDSAFKQLKTNIELNLSKDKQKAIDDLIGNF